MLTYIFIFIFFAGPQFVHLQDESNKILIKQEVVASQNYDNTLEGAQKQLEKEIQLINPLNISEIKVEDDDVVVIDNSEDIIEINDDEDVKENVDVQKATKVDEVKSSSTTLNLPEGEEDIKPPCEIVDSVIPETNKNQDLLGTDKREDDEVDKKVDKLSSDEAIKMEFEATDSGVLKKESDNEKVNIDIDTNDKNVDMTENVVVEEFKLIIESDEKKCVVSSEELETTSSEHINKHAHCSTQTVLQEELLTVDLFLETNFRETPTNLSQAVARMLIIDQWVATLTAYRQKILQEFTNSDNEKSGAAGKKLKKRRIVNEEIEFSDNEDIGKEILEDCVEEITFDDIDDSPTTDISLKIDKVDDVIAVTCVSIFYILLNSF